MSNCIRITKKVSFICALSAAASSAFAVDVTPVLSGTFGGGAIKMIEPMTITPGSADMGLGIGVLVTHPVHEKVEVESGLLYFEDGGSYTIKKVPLGPGLSGETKAKVKVHFLRIPVVAHYIVMPKLSVGGGIYYAKGIGKVKGEGKTSLMGNVVNSQSVNQSWTQYGLNTDDFGLLFDVNYDYPVAATIDFHASIKYAYGLVDLAKKSNKFPNQTFKSFKETDLSILLGAKFAI